MKTEERYSTNYGKTSTTNARIFSLNLFATWLNKQTVSTLQKVFSGPGSELSFNPLDYKKSTNLYYPYTQISTTQKIVKHILFWTISFVTLLYFVSLVKPFSESVERTSINIIGFMFLFYTSKRLVFTYYEDKQYRKWIGLSILATSLAAVVRTITEVNIIGTTLFSKKPFIELSDDLKLAQFGFYFVIGHIFFLFFTVYNISKIKSTLEFRLSKYKLQHAELKLRLLNAQLDPHFLFNTLNSIYAISILDNRKTPDLILKLSDILRFITQNSQQKRIPLTVEIEQTKNFLELFRLRNDNPINAYLEIADDLNDIQLIPMTLLTLVENAVKYGNLTTNNDDCFINISVRKEEPYVCLSVINSYNRNITDQQSTGLGNKILRERLEMEYPGNYQFRVTDKKNRFTAELKIRY